MGRFGGKVAIVTGAASGIGAATARRLASEGAAVTLADVDFDRATALAEELEAAGHRVLAQAVDVAEADQVEAMVAATVGAFGGLTRYVATAYGDRGVRCNAVAPGVVVAADVQESLGGPMGDSLRRYSTSHLTGRLGYPEEIAAAVAFLASDEAAFVTGETLRVDGGFTAHSPTYATDRESSDSRYGMSTTRPNAARLSR